MPTYFEATPAKRRYNQWVANETIEDFALRFTARRARRWSMARVANTAIGSISFLALEAIGAAITLSYGFDTAVVAIMLVGAILFLTGLPISYYAARYGVDIDLLTRGAGFGYLGSTITSLIYASFTFIFFALEAAILALALELCFGVPLFFGYILGSLVVIPLVVNGFTKISAFQAWTQPAWIVMHLIPFVLLAWVGYDLESWVNYPGLNGEGSNGITLVMLGAASGVILSLIAQIGEQVDFLRFLPEPKTPRERYSWWASLLLAGPGWSILGVIKMLAGSYLVTLALSHGVPPEDASDPTQMYYTAFDLVLASPGVVLFLTGTFVILSQLKINVTNAYAGSIAWSNFFSRLTHSHPGRVVWLVFNVGIALMLMEFGVFGALEATLGLYAHVALAWIGALVADLVVNKPMGLSPKGIEFRRAYLYDLNPVGIGAMGSAVVLSLIAYGGLLGPVAAALSSFIALATAFVLAPLIAFGTQGRYYLAREEVARLPQGLNSCVNCGYRFDAEDMADCPFFGGHICSLCCSLDNNCEDFCKPHGRAGEMIEGAIHATLPQSIARLVATRWFAFALAFSALGGIAGAVLLLIANSQDDPRFNSILGVIFCSTLIVIGVGVWMLILVQESRRVARNEADLQTERLLREIRAHERTDLELQSAKEKAEAANLAKTRYLAGLSHELRTPLNSIYGFAQILEADPEIPEKRHSAVSTIRRNSEHLAGLIEGLLDISKIEAGRVEIYRDRINLSDFLLQITRIIEQQAHEKSLKFCFETEGALPTWVTSDEKRLRQILLNLLTNAVRYTDRGEVRLRIAYRNEIAQIDIIDTGQGISEDERERIWKPFERGHSTRSYGSGLGLTITKLLVEILGGDITLDSTPGRGSTFSVRLMLPSLYDTESKGPVLRHGVTERGRVIGYEGKRKTIMVVDDDPSHLALAEGFLAPIGFHVVSAASVQDAEARIADVKPDAFILDVDMPGATGWTLARHIRQSGFRTAPIIMVSGHARGAKPFGPEAPDHDLFIDKPYSLPDLVEELARLMRLSLRYKAEAEQEQAAQIEQNLQPLSPSTLKALVSAAEIGHVRQLRDILEETKSKDLHPDEDTRLSELERLLDAFDLTGIQRELAHWSARP